MQEEFVTEVGSNPLEGRKSLGKITLVEGETPSTRWTVDNWNTFTPEVGDGFSYLLVDEPREGLAGQHDYPIDNYELVNHIHTNYVFKKNGNGWDSEANLVEGNYLLIGPSQNVQNRKPVEIKLPAEQNLSLDADGKVDPLSILEEFVESEYPIYIGHRFLSEGSDYNNVLPARYSIFAYPEITVKNSERNDELTPRVTKVVLKRTTKPFIINAPLDNVKAARLLTNESFEKKGTDTKDQYVVGEWEAYMNDSLGTRNSKLRLEQVAKNERENTQEIPATATYEITMLKAASQETLKTFKYNNGLKGFTSDLLADQPTSTSQYIVINMPGNGVEVPRGTEFTFSAVIPADQYVMDTKNSDLTLYAVLANGEVYKKVMTSNETVEIYPGKRYPDQDYTGMTVKPEGTPDEPGRGEYFTIDVNEGGSDGVSDYVKCDPSEIGEIVGVNAVKTTEDLIAVITDNSSTLPLSITVEGDKVVYNDAVNKAVANNKSQIINILGHIKVEGGDQALNVSDKVSFDDAVINKGTVVFDSKTATLGTVLVGKGATLELKNAGDDAAVIYNIGTLKLRSDNFASVDNFGTLEVYTNLTSKAGYISNDDRECADKAEEIISDPVVLNAEVIIKAESEEVVGTYQINDDKLEYPITVEGTEDYKAGLVLGTNVTIVKGGSIVNNGTISGKDSSDPTKETLTVQCGNGETLTNEVNGVIKSDVIIEGASHTLATLKDNPVAPAEYKAAAEVTNNGEMENVKVDGKLTMGANSRVNGNITASPATEGEIDNTAKGVIVSDPSTVDVEVFARFDGLNLETLNAREAVREKIKAYAENYKVSVIRLTGEVKVGDCGDNVNHLMTDETGEVILEFAAGSSMSIGFGTFKTDLDVKVSAKNVEWNGKTTDGSKVSLTGADNGKELYLTTKEGKYTAAEGNVWFRNCEVETDLGSATPVE